MKKDLLIIIPAYNEQESIDILLDKMYSLKIDKIGDIVVINDGSQDDTEKVVRQHNVTIINKVCNMGYGSALQVGYKYAKKNGYDYVIQIDADGQHDINNINTIYNYFKNYGDDTPDIIIGSRFLEKNNNLYISRIKYIAISFFRLVIKVTTKENITDPTSGLQGLNKKAFSYYAGYGNFEYRYPDINMIIQMIMRGYIIKEIPAIMYDRKTGESMHSGIIRPIKYMVLILLSTLNILIRNRKASVYRKERTK
jgi:glycosyltransferase involved in cell wall biosynthesis